MICIRAECALAYLLSSKHPVPDSGKAIGTTRAARRAGIGGANQALRESRSAVTAGLIQGKSSAYQDPRRARSRRCRCHGRPFRLTGDRRLLGRGSRGIGAGLADADRRGRGDRRANSFFSKCLGGSAASADAARAAAHQSSADCRIRRLGRRLRRQAQRHQCLAPVSRVQINLAWLYGASMVGGVLMVIYALASAFGPIGSPSDGIKGS